VRKPCDIAQYDVEWCFFAGDIRKTIFPSQFAIDSCCERGHPLHETEHGKASAHERSASMIRADTIFGFVNIFLEKLVICCFCYDGTVVERINGAG